MKNSVFIIVLLLFVLLFTLFPLLFDRPEMAVQGRVSIPDAGIRAEVMTASHGASCGCCGAFWNGGVGYVSADMDAVMLDNKATLTTLDGGRLVLECVEIKGCIKIGKWLIAVDGITRADGDVLFVSMTNSPFVRVFRFIRL